MIESFSMRNAICIVFPLFIFLFLASCNEKPEKPFGSEIGLPLNTIQDIQDELGVGDLIEECSDEFNGDSLNVEIWDVADSTWWVPTIDSILPNFRNDSKNAIINNAHGVLELKYDFDGRYFTNAWIKSKRAFTEGYFEIRCKMSVGVGKNHAFWLLGGFTNNNTYDEVDIVEAIHLSAENGQRFSSNFHIANNDQNINFQKHPANKIEVNKLTDTFHTFGLLITEEFITWYWNNKEIRKEPNTLHGTPMNVMLSASRFAENQPKSLEEAQVPSKFIIDYFRVFNVR
jgi:hypothetical protein